MKTLVELFDKYKCDKGSLKHRYDRVYEPALQSLLDKSFTMLEIGIFKGNSTEAWVEYFPHVNIVGVDIFERVKMEDIPILKHPRVVGYKGSSLNKLKTKFNNIASGGFDVIIDDGLHTHEAQWKTFVNFIPHLKNGGKYFIEDVWPFDLMTPSEKEHYWLKKHAPAFSEENYQKLLNAINQYTVVYHDLRKGYDPDTFIIEVRK
ncbi:MAG: class I SAM-dependent methyltransferase [Richelia sp. RM2_1_2]|nr:class I SAM-dependent methyltransferase [Richelia sp. RM2_1_2]